MPLTAPGASLSGAFTWLPLGTNVNLSAEGQLDWGHWGLLSEWSYNHKYGVAPQITYAFITDTNDGYPYPDGPYRLTDSTNSYSWSNGTPTAAVTNSSTGIYIFGDKLPSNIPMGFQVQCPADTTPRRLRLYVGTFGAKLTTLTATLGNAPTFTDSSLANPTGPSNGVYTLDFRADTPGQILTVLFNCSDNSGNITLEAATLAGQDAPPAVTLTAPTAGAVFAAPGSLSLNAVAGDADGTVTNLTLLNGTTVLGQSTTNSWCLPLTNLPGGRYQFLAVATDNSGLSITSSPATVYVTTGGGTLSGSAAVPPAQVDLTADGARDWAHWGLLTNSSFDAKSTGPGLLCHLALLNASTNDLVQYLDNFAAFSWSDGSPDPSAFYSTSGVFLYATNQPPAVFQFSVSATNLLRRLKLYVGLYGAQGRLEAWLDDWSAVPYSDASLSAVYDNAWAVYTLSFASPNPNTQLHITWSPTVLFDPLFGNLTWQAATLVELLPPPALQVLNPPAPGTFAFGFPTDPAANYAVLFTDSLAPANWQVLTNFPGSGTDAVVTDSAPDSAQRFYRVQIQ